MQRSASAEAAVSHREGQPVVEACRGALRQPGHRTDAAHGAVRELRGPRLRDDVVPRPCSPGWNSWFAICASSPRRLPRLHQNGDHGMHGSVRAHRRRAPVPAQRYEFDLLTFLAFCRWVTGRELRPRAVELAQPDAGRHRHHTTTRSSARCGSTRRPTACGSNGPT